MGLRPRFKSPLSQTRDQLVSYAIRPFMLFEPRKRFLILSAILITLTTLLLLTSTSSGLIETYKEGQVLNRVIVSPADITTVDIGDTEQKRAAARKTAKSVFNFDSSRAETSVQSFRAAWDDLKEQNASGVGKPTWSGEGGNAVVRAILSHNFNEAELDRLTAIIRETAASYIYDDNDADRLEQDIVIVDVRNPLSQIIMPAPRTRMIAVSAARRNL